MEFAKFLKQEEIEQIHEASLDILENVGLLVRSEKARDIFVKHGCSVDDNGVVKIPAKIVEECRKSYVPTFTLNAQDPSFDVTVSEDELYVLTASSAPNIIDPKTGEERLATSSDIANIGHLINELPGFDIFTTSCLANDAPQDKISVTRWYPALKHCKKPIRSNIPSYSDLQQILELGYEIAGSKEAYMERPLLHHHCCAVVSPLTMDVESTDTIIDLTEKGLPAYATLVPNAGLTSPMSMPGTLVVANAEFLALATLRQLIRPGTPNLYSVFNTVGDMRTGAYAPGGVETSMFLVAHAQMARFYGVPTSGIVGLTNAHCNDAQSGYESGIGPTAACLGGANFIQFGGLFGALMAFDYRKAVIDNEIALNIKRMKRGLEFSQENMCVDLIKQAGPGGNYMGLEHTFQNMKTTAFLPKIATRDMRSLWEENGRPDSDARAWKIVNNILSKDNLNQFPAELDARIHAQFPGLVSGEKNWG